MTIRRSASLARAARLTLGAAAPILLLLAIWQLRSVLLLLLAAILVAVIIDGLARLQGRVLPVSHGVRLTIAALVLVGTGGAIAYMFGHELERQITQLLALLPGGIADLKDRLGEARVNAIADRLSPSGASIVALMQVIFSLVASALSGLFLAVIGGVFLATRPNTYRQGIIMLVPARHEERTAQLLNALVGGLRAWLRGQLVSMAFVGTTIYAGLVLIGAPSPLALALIAAILGFVPVIGPLLAAIPAVLIGLALPLNDLVMIVLLYFVVQNFDGNVLNPLVMRHVVKIPPALTMFALFAVGVLFGPIGVLLGGPITVVVFILVRQLWVRDALGKPIS
ncbi:AI-2E family transporter [Croceicoccus sp. F390]|uniref:AI-2E family transporter n=1 Tax=Croceicoccus esteveae TaxID=3075597 RepID=A0ABU2ZKW7_9SPHN|nr:AI-2E family transporter [Croceicoccus sp. F390]MDT0577035.1 AI-2E family transporter [Croceicoccus sp. F390]